jgi:unsaturated rhamnogalacturonyl hydrolase
MILKRILSGVAVAAVVAVVTPAMAAPKAATSKAPVAVFASQASVDAVGRKVAAWQLAHMDNFDYVPVNAFRKDTAAPRDWIQAAV